jgi:hypothetical protein
MNPIHITRYLSVRSDLKKVYDVVSKGIQFGVLTPECLYWSNLAQEWEQKGFPDSFFQEGVCAAPRSIEIERGLRDIYLNRYGPLKQIVNAMESLEQIQISIDLAWGNWLEEATRALAEAIDLYENALNKIGEAFQTVLGPVADIMNAVVDKVRSIRSRPRHAWQARLSLVLISTFKSACDPLTAD